MPVVYAYSFLTKPIACVVVGVHVGLVQVRVILPRQLSQLIVGIPRHLAALVGDPCDIAVGIVGIRVCGRGAVHLRPVRADLPGGAPAAELPVPVAHCPAEAACLPLKKNLMKLQNTIHSKLFKLRAKRVLFLNLIIEDITDCSRVKHIPNLTTI